MTFQKCFTKTFQRKFFSVLKNTWYIFKSINTYQPAFPSNAEDLDRELLLKLKTLSFSVCGVVFRVCELSLSPNQIAV